MTIPKATSFPSTAIEEKDRVEVETISLTCDESKTIPESHSESLVLPKARFDGLQKQLNDLWAWEIFAWLFSVASLATLVGVAARYNGQPLPQWPFGITLNAFIAVFSSISKATMVTPLASAVSQLRWSFYSKRRPLRHFPIFDLAGREPWAALRLILATRGMHFVAFGALITTLAIAIDPFVQQIVTYPYEPIHNHIATIPWAQNYSAFGGLDANRNAGHGAIQAMTGAIYSGIFSDPEHPQKSDVDFTCPTGNCTWPPFQSLAVCSKCANITDKLEKTTINEAHPMPDGLSDPKAALFTLPNGLTLNAAAEWLVAAGNRSKLLVLRDEGQTFASVSVIKQKAQLNNDVSHHIVADECVLYFCVNTFKSSVLDGNLTEQILATWHNSSIAGGLRSLFDDWSGKSGYSQPERPVLASSLTGTTSSSTSDDGYKWGAPSEAYDSSGQSYSIAVMADPSGSTVDLTLYMRPPDQLGNTTLMFYVSGLATVNLMLNFNTLMTGTWKSSSVVGPEDGYSSPLYALYYQDTDAMFKRIAKSMTTSLRQHTDQGALLRGDATTWLPHVRMRWEWLILPISLEVLTLVFLAYTIVTVRRDHIPVWKDSTLPLLRMKLVGEAGNLLDTCGGLDEMEKFADATEVQFKRSETDHTMIGTFKAIDGGKTINEP